MELKKKYKDIAINNAHVGVTDTLALYGFDHFVDIKKQYRFVSIKGCKVIGHGGHGTIYKIGEDTIIKVYRDHSPLEVIESERQYAKNAFVHGIPTAIAYDVVETEEGYGVIFEMINGMTLGKFLKNNPDKLDEYSVKFADVLRMLHTTEADHTLYDDFKSMCIQRAESTKKYIPEADAEALKRIVNAIPNGVGMIHGDYHTNNIMVDDEGELVLIDMADISRGNGFFDLGGSYLLFKWLAKVPLLNLISKSITSLTGKQCLRLWDILLHRYFDTNDEQMLKDLDEKYSAFANTRISLSLGMDSSNPIFVKKLMGLYTRIFIVPKADEYIKLFSTTK